MKFHVEMNYIIKVGEQVFENCVVTTKLVEIDKESRDCG